MIVSASYKTDIPAFYSEWFMNRLHAGYCMVKSSYGGQNNRVSLLAKDVDGFVFWTRNIDPLAPYLPEIRETAPFVVHMTITNYPKALENSVIAVEKAIVDLRKIADIYGPKSVVWRYDPLFISPETPVDWHFENFSKLAQKLNGVSDEVVVSFMQFYKKADLNMLRDGITWTNPLKAEKPAILERLAEIASSNGFQLTLCTQPDLVSDKTPPARCIDATRIAAVGGKVFKSRVKGNRPGCLCAESRDIGRYDSCPHGCIYCYAVAGQHVAKGNYKIHNPLDEHL